MPGTDAARSPSHFNSHRLPPGPACDPGRAGTALASPTPRTASPPATLSTRGGVPGGACGFSETMLPEKFGIDNNQVLVVVEKYQTVATLRLYKHCPG